MSNLALLERQIEMARNADDEESVRLFEQERVRIITEETDWIPNVLRQAKEAEDFETVTLLQNRLDAVAKPPEIKYEDTYKLPAAPKTIYEEKEEEESSFLENVLGGSSTGFTGLFETSALGAVTLLEEEAELKARKVIQSVGDSLSTDIGDPDAMSYKISQGLGSIGAMIATGLAATAAVPTSVGALGVGLIGTAAAGLLTGSAGAGEASERARAYGTTEEERNTAAVKGLGIGVLEVAPWGRLLKIPGVGKLIEKLGGEGVGLIGRLRSAAVGGVGEGFQEAIAAVLQNLTAQGYNPEQELIDAGVAEEGEIGAYSGGIFQFFADLVSGRRGRIRTTSRKTPSTEYTDAETNELLDLPVEIDEETGTPFVTDKDGQRQEIFDDVELQDLINGAKDKRLTDLEEKKILKAIGWKRTPKGFESDTENAVDMTEDLQGFLDSIQDRETDTQVAKEDADENAYFESLTEEEQGKYIAQKIKDQDAIDAAAAAVEEEANLNKEEAPVVKEAEEAPVVEEAEEAPVAEGVPVKGRARCSRAPNDQEKSKCL